MEGPTRQNILEAYSIRLMLIGNGYELTVWLGIRRDRWKRFLFNELFRKLTHFSLFLSHLIRENLSRTRLIDHRIRRRKTFPPENAERYFCKRNMLIIYSFSLAYN